MCEARSTAADPGGSDPDLVVSAYYSWFIGVLTGAEASCATKFTDLPSCCANELVHRRVGVFCTVFTSVHLKNGTF